MPNENNNNSGKLFDNLSVTALVEGIKNKADKDYLADISVSGNNLVLANGAGTTKSVTLQSEIPSGLTLSSDQATINFSTDRSEGFDFINRNGVASLNGSNLSLVGPTVDQISSIYGGLELTIDATDIVYLKSSEIKMGTNSRYMTITQDPVDPYLIVTPPSGEFHVNGAIYAFDSSGNIALSSNSIYMHSGSGDVMNIGISSGGAYIHTIDGLTLGSGSSGGLGSSDVVSHMYIHNTNAAQVNGSYPKIDMISDYLSLKSSVATLPSSLSIAQTTDDVTFTSTATDGFMFIKGNDSIALESFNGPSIIMNSSNPSNHAFISTPNDVLEINCDGDDIKLTAPDNIIFASPDSNSATLDFTIDIDGFWDINPSNRELYINSFVSLNSLNVDGNISLSNSTPVEIISCYSGLNIRSDSETLINIGHMTNTYTGSTVGNLYIRDTTGTQSDGQYPIVDMVSGYLSIKDRVLPSYVNFSINNNANYVECAVSKHEFDININNTGTAYFNTYSNDICFGLTARDGNSYIMATINDLYIETENDANIILGRITHNNDDYTGSTVGNLYIRDTTGTQSNDQYPIVDMVAEFLALKAEVATLKTALQQANATIESMFNEGV